MTKGIELPNQEKIRSSEKKKQVLGNIESRHHQISGDERKYLKKSIFDKQERFLKPSSAAGISSKR